LQAPDGAPAGSVWAFSIEQFDGGANYVVQYYCRFSTKRINLSDVLISTTHLGAFAGWLIFKLQLEAL
jgi:hypothetical protein